MRKLIYFATIVERGSFKSEARIVSPPQPALSSTMDRLVASLGLKVLERGPNGAVPAGSSFYIAFFYNPQRKNVGNGLLSPIVFEQQKLKLQGS